MKVALQNANLRWTFMASLCRPTWSDCSQNLGAVCFWQPSGLNLVVAAVLRDSPCVIAALRGRQLHVVYRV